MISRRYNTYASFQKVPPAANSINGHYLAPERVPYFRSLWRRRGQWISLPVLMEDARDANQARAQDTLWRLRSWLEYRVPGFRIETKRETVFPEDAVHDQDTVHDYYRLVTDETLPPPTFTGEATLNDTEDREVPLEDADAI